MRKNAVVLFLLPFFLTLGWNQAITKKASADPPPWNTDARISYFYEQLQPYGEWFRHDKYGWCWYPYNMPIDWRPYTDGYWVYTDAGWTWVSDLPWGWACFHYGRWFFQEAYGWCWYPDIVWAPSWCVWRTGGDWIGWAPLPPEAFWSADEGLVFTDFDADDFIPRHAFCFVRRHEFLDREISHRVRMSARNVTIFQETKLTVKNLKISNKKIENELPVHQELEKTLGYSIKRRKIMEVDSPFQSSVTEDEVRLFRPGRIRTGAPSGTAVFKQKSEEMNAQPFAAKPGVSEEEIRPQIIPGGRREGQVSSDLIQRHNNEMRALRELQENRSRALQEEHSRELENTPKGAAAEQLQQRHKKEATMEQEQVNREQQMLRSWHNREENITFAPGAQPHSRFNFTAPRQGTKEGSGREKKGAEEPEDSGFYR